MGGEVGEGGILESRGQGAEKIGRLGEGVEVGEIPESRGWGEGEGVREGKGEGEKMRR